jgi:opacity protein-like surface antigen
MRFTTVATALLATGASAAAIPEPAASSTLQARQQTGSYTIAGLGQRKQQVTAAGANSFNLAIAMLETEKMDTTYAYGDNKQNDSANFGIFKQNWGLLRECCSKFKGQSQSQWNNGAALKYDFHVICISCNR